MTLTPDSPLVDRTLVAEAYDRKGAPILGVVIHMAEGGGTDTWLTRIDGNSAHYVIKYGGDLVQLVPESKAAGSMNPRAARTDDDRPFTLDGEAITYGRTALNAVLGDYAGILVNRAVIAIEIEGFAAAGPNVTQSETLGALVADIRRRRGNVGLLGHRDQQSYKACPGKLIPWSRLGGHGIPDSEPDMPGLATAPQSPLIVGKVTIPAGTEVIRLEDRVRLGFNEDGVRQATGIYIRKWDNTPGYYIDYQGDTCWVPTDAVTFTVKTTPVELKSYPVIVGGKAVGSVTLP